MVKSKRHFIKKLWKIPLPQQNQKIMKRTYFIIATIFSSIVFAQNKIDSIKIIEEVNITSTKKLLERKADRLIFNVEASLASQGMDAVETLANVPMLKIDEDQNTISVIGKSSVSVMVNGRMLNISGDALMNYLKTIRSENIAKIEVITTPPAKYEAQGNSGIINIVLKKNPNLGFSGSIGTGIHQRTYFGGNANGSLNYQTEKLSLSFKTNYLNSAKRTDENYSILGSTESFSKSIRKDMWENLAPSVALSYKLSEKSEIGFNYLFTDQKPNMNIVNTTNYLENGSNIENLFTDTKHREKNTINTVSIYYDLKLDSIGKKLSITGNYYGNNSRTNVDFNTLKSSNQTTEFVNTSSLIQPEIFSAQADLELPFSFGTIETGAKFTHFKNDSDLRYFTLQNSEWIQNSSRSNLFQYKEKNSAGYLTLAKNFGEKWQTKIGVRYEQTLVDGYTPSTGEHHKNDYGQWFPSAYVSYKNNKNTYSLTYSRRINRPDMDNLNPFRWYSNTYSYSSGNPLLQPSYINNYELSYTYNNKLNASLYYLHLKNGFGQISFQNGLENYGTYLNTYDNDFFGFNISYTDKIFPWWEASMYANASLTQSKIYNVEATPKNGKTLDYSIRNTFTLNKLKTISFFLNFSQNLPYYNANSYTHSFTNLDSGLKVLLMEKQLQINASVSNIFAQRWRGDLYYADNSQHFNNYWDGRGFRLSVNYTFGNKKVKEAKTIDFEEKSRAK